MTHSYTNHSIPSVGNFDSGYATDTIIPGVGYFSVDSSFTAHVAPWDGTSGTLGTVLTATYGGGSPAGTPYSCQPVDTTGLDSSVLVLTSDGELDLWGVANDGTPSWVDKVSLTNLSSSSVNEIILVAPAFDTINPQVAYVYYSTTPTLGGDRVKKISWTNTGFGSLADVTPSVAAGIQSDFYGGPGGFSWHLIHNDGIALSSAGRGDGHFCAIQGGSDLAANNPVHGTTPVSGGTITNGYTPLSKWANFVSMRDVVISNSTSTMIERWDYNGTAMVRNGSFDLSTISLPAGISIDSSYAPYCVQNATIGQSRMFALLVDSSLNNVGYVLVYDPFGDLGSPEVNIRQPTGGNLGLWGVLLWGIDDTVQVLVEQNTVADRSGTQTNSMDVWSGAGTNNAHCGDKVAKYTVTTATGSPYRVTPQGPNDSKHHSAFKIADARSISAMFSLAGDDSQDFYVQPQARFLTWTGVTFTTVSSMNLGSPVHIVGDATWTTTTRYSASVPSGATHWYLDFSVQGNSAGTTVPSIGTILYLDCVYVPDNGLDVSAEPYLDGDQVGTTRGDGRWEGAPHDSTSVWGSLTPPDDTDPPPGDSSGGSGGTDAPTDPADDTPPSTVPVPTIAPSIILDQAAALVTRKHPAKTFCLDADVQLGDHLFNTIDEYGTLWVIEDIDGWWNLPDPDIPDITRGIDDGSYQTRGRYSARIFTITGSFWPTAPTETRASRDRLIRAMNLCHYGAWFATHEVDATRASMVWLSGRPSVATVNDNGRTDFSIGLKAPDPIKYGLFGGVLPGWNSVALKSSTSTADFGRVYDRAYVWSYPTVPSGGVLADIATVSNDGNVRVSPIIAVYGPTLGPIDIHNITTSQTMRIRLGLAADDILLIDCQNRTVSLNGVPNKRLYLDTINDWIYLDPGTNKFNYTEETGSSASFITVQWRSGWIG